MDNLGFSIAQKYHHANQYDHQGCAHQWVFVINNKFYENNDLS